MAALDLTSVKSQATSVLKGFTLGQRVVTVLALAGIALGGMAFTKWAAQPSWAPLYSDLEPEDAAAIADELTTQGVPFELAAGGRTIMVPQQQLYGLRLDMSAAGLPAGSASGYALLDEQGITTSEFRQRIDYQRALEGELSRTIGYLETVEQAQVHLVIPADDVFSQDDKKPSASVLLTLDQGSAMGSGQVQAVVHLVASSVEGLVPEQVTVADTEGTVLSAPGRDGTSIAAGDARSQQTAAFEQDLEDSVETMLAEVVGQDAAVVTVRADLDFDERSITTERYEPKVDAPTLAEDVTSETYTGEGVINALGILGPDGSPATADGGGDTAYERGDATRTYALDRIVEEIQSAPGTVQRLSVAVLLDGASATAADPVAVQRLVTAATGLDAARGDTIEVSSMAFDRSEDTGAGDAAEAAAAERKQAQMMSLAQTGAAAFVVLVVLFLAYRSMKRSTPARPAKEKSSRKAAKTIPVDVAQLGDPKRDALGAGEADGLLEAAQARELERPPVSPEEQLRQELEENVVELIDNQPEDVAVLLRGWLSDRRSVSR